MSDSFIYRPKDDVHRLLRRQLKKALSDGQVTPDSFDTLTDLINRTYESYDEDRKLNQHAEFISNQELQDANRQLRSKNEFLDSFNYGLAHDVKNHTANIQGLVKMLIKYQKTSDGRMMEQIISKLDGTLNQMSSILNGFLYLANAETDVGDKFTQLHSERLTNEVLIEVSHLLTGHEDQLDLDIRVDGLFYSSHILRIILVNLVSNSIKFSKSTSQMSIKASVWYDQQYVCVKVTDNGIGMDLSKDGARILSLFGRTEKKQETRGYGIGLYIVKKILDHHNGQIEIQSKPNEGTTMDIKLRINHDV